MINATATTIAFNPHLCSQGCWIVRFEDGPDAGSTWMLDGPAYQGETLPVRYSPEDQFCVRYETVVPEPITITRVAFEFSHFGWEVSFSDGRLLTEWKDGDILITRDGEMLAELTVDAEGEIVTSAWLDTEELRTAHTYLALWQPYRSGILGETKTR